MRIGIVIDDKLMKGAMHLSGLPTKRETVQHALQLLVKLSQQEETKKFKGKLQWEGDLDAMRTDHDVAPKTVGYDCQA